MNPESNNKSECCIGAGMTSPRLGSIQSQHDLSKVLIRRRKLPMQVVQSSSPRAREWPAQQNWTLPDSCSPRVWGRCKVRPREVQDCLKQPATISWQAGLFEPPSHILLFHGGMILPQCVYTTCLQFGSKCAGKHRRNFAELSYPIKCSMYRREQQ